MLDRVRGHFESERLPEWKLRASSEGGAAPDEVTHAFWTACHGGQLPVAEYLRERGADINWIGYDNLTPLGAAERTGAPELVAWLRQIGAKSTQQLQDDAGA